MISMCFDHSVEKKTQFEKNVIFGVAGLDKGLAELMPLWHEYCEIAGYGKLEVTRKIWDKIWTEEEAAAFLKQYAIIGKEAPASIVNHLAGDEGHFVAHDYARDVVKEYFDSVTSSVDEQWKLYEKICCGHMSMSGMLNKTYRP